MESDKKMIWKKEELDWEHWQPLEAELTGLPHKVWVCTGGQPENWGLTVRCEVNEDEFILLTVEDDPKIVIPDKK